MADDNLGVEKPGGEQPGGGDAAAEAARAAEAAKGGGGGGAPGGEKSYTFKEDRSDWIPKHRLGEVSGKLTKAEQEREQLRQELEAERKRVQALAGVTPQDPKAKETEDLRSAMYQLFPQLQALENLSVEQLQDVFEAANAAKTTAAATWERHAEEMLGGVEQEIKSALGTDKLTPTQTRALRRAYREEAQMCLADRKRAHEAGDTSYDLRGDFVSRHERGDRALIKEFAKSFLGDWYEPAVRSVTARNASRNMRPLPRGDRGRAPLTQTPPSGDLTKDSDFKKALLAARGAE